MDIKALLKSKTFWGGFVYAIAQYLNTQGIIPEFTCNMIEAVGVSLGLFGARNTLSKKG